jgi:acetoin utilization protein AcuA
MKMIDSQEILLKIPEREVRIRSFFRSERIHNCTFDRCFTTHGPYKSLYTSRRLLEEAAEQPGANVVLAATEDNHIIGYGILAYPAPGERWADLGPKLMMEVSAIEVVRPWRSLKIASTILKLMTADPSIEDRIAYMVGYSWTWDLSGTANTAQQYREMLVKLFEPHGFQEYRTNEPNVCLKPENLFMCRVGKNITQVIRDRFKWLRFGLSPWIWEVS